MRLFAVVFALFMLASCRAQVTNVASRQSNPGPAKAVELKPGSTDSVVQFLITSCATDFHDHRPPDPVRFRDVRVGHFVTPAGKTEYILCGEFLPALGGDKAEWTPFVTIQTSGYEQYLGPQAASFCKNPSVTMDAVDDLSSALLERFNSLR